MNNEELMTVAEVAKRLRITPNALYIMNSRGTGPKVTKVGNRVRYRRADVEAFERGEEAELAA